MRIRRYSGCRRSLNEKVLRKPDAITAPYAGMIFEAAVSMPITQKDRNCGVIALVNLKFYICQRFETLIWSEKAGS